MKANELRIGNWVHDGSKFPMQVVAIFEDEVYLNFEGNEGGVWEVNIKDLQPFELDKQWLEKFGFEHKLNKYESYYVNQNYLYLKLEFYEYQKEWWLRNNKAICDFKYVHQLQNIYHALTGEEL